ncbi:MAG: hypothetical protein EKK42_18705, partial [Pseudonocardiaceae bacterium]
MAPPRPTSTFGYPAPGYRATPWALACARVPAFPVAPRRRRARGPNSPGDVVTIAPEGRKLLRLEVRNSETPIERKPS